MAKHRTSLKDIAQELGVSIATVSRALHSSPEIGQDMQQRVKELAKRLKRFGILPGDLLININATELKDFETLQKELRQDMHSAKLIREQKTIMLE